MARFIKVGFEILNLDAIDHARLNYDNRGGIAIRIGTSPRMRERDAACLSVLQQESMEGNVRFFTGETAALLTSKLLEDCEDLTFSRETVKQSA